MGLAFCCAYSSLIGVFFYGCLYFMVYNRNEVFLEYKVKADTQEKIENT